MLNYFFFQIQIIATNDWGTEHTHRVLGLSPKEPHIPNGASGGLCEDQHKWVISIIILLLSLSLLLLLLLLLLFLFIDAKETYWSSNMLLDRATHR